MSTLLLYFNLFREFLQIGLFSFGGGYATLPFLYEITKHYSWYTPQELTQMIAVATITPGPVGINVATYAGMKAGGVMTALFATASEVLPALIIGIMVSKLLKKFSDNFYVQSALWALKPVSCALLAFVAINLFKQNVVHCHNIAFGWSLFLMLLLMSFLRKKDPLWYISVSAIAGILFVIVV